MKRMLEERTDSLLVSRAEASDLREKVEVYEREMKVIVDREKARVRDEIEKLREERDRAKRELERLI